jgi:DNA-binding LacI/PurR family transcriptional regulator
MNTYARSVPVTSHDIARRAGRRASRGMDVPASLWIVDYDYIDMARWHAYDLTTLRQSLVCTTETAVSLLMNRIRGLGGKWNTV